MASELDYKNVESFYDLVVKDADGEDLELKKYDGNVCLVVNTASKCGLAETNHKQLMELRNRFESKGLRILAFPSDQFNQEPDTANAYIAHLKSKGQLFGDVFDKVEVNGADGSPLYKYLKFRQPGTFGDFIKWNYTKFIIDKKGQPVERYGPTTDPNEIIEKLQSYLVKQA